MHLEALLSRPNVVFTPHVAFNTREAIERINRETLGNIRAFETGEPVNQIRSTSAG
jgi:D-lactate dehydrogenase